MVSCPQLAGEKHGLYERADRFMSLDTRRIQGRGQRAAGPEAAWVFGLCRNQLARSRVPATPFANADQAQRVGGFFPSEQF
jgi:hypothetical protein